MIKRKARKSKNHTRKDSPIDLSGLRFLEYGDKTLISVEMTLDGMKVNSSYVSEVCNGKHVNGRIGREILRRAFALAQKRKGALPIQAIKA